MTCMTALGDDYDITDVIPPEGWDLRKTGMAPLCEDDDILRVASSIGD